MRPELRSCFLYDDKRDLLAIGRFLVRSDNTSSSAVAKRPRDASCLSVVSFNSTQHRVESFIVSYVGYRFVTACS